MRLKAVPVFQITRTKASAVNSFNLNKGLNWREMTSISDERHSKAQETSTELKWWSYCDFSILNVPVQGWEMCNAKTKSFDYLL